MKFVVKKANAQKIVFVSLPLFTFDVTFISLFSVVVVSAFGDSSHTIIIMTTAQSANGKICKLV